VGREENKEEKERRGPATLPSTGLLFEQMMGIDLKWRVTWWFTK
jgi:hypothetical protein